MSDQCLNIQVQAMGDEFRMFSMELFLEKQMAGSGSFEPAAVTPSAGGDGKAFNSSPITHHSSLLSDENLL